MRTMLRLAAPALLVVLAGCITDTTTVKVKADGSGTVEKVTLMSVEKAAMLAAMAKQMGGDEAKPPELLSAEKAKAAAAKMGEGVTFVSAEPIKTPKEQGLKAVYAFTDITKLKLSSGPDAPEGGEPKKEEEKEQIQFKLAKLPNGNALVTAVFEEKAKPAAEKKEAAKEPEPGELMMMKQVLGGLKVSVIVEPQGTVVKTNSPYNEAGKVTLLEFDLDPILKDDALLKKFAASQDQNLSFEQARVMFKDVPGLKIPPAKEITIEFTGK
jgi:hypothetical protein